MGFFTGSFFFVIDVPGDQGFPAVIYGRRVPRARQRSGMIRAALGMMAVMRSVNVGRWDMRMESYLCDGIRN